MRWPTLIGMTLKFENCSRFRFKRTFNYLEEFVPVDKDIAKKD